MRGPQLYAQLGVKGSMDIIEPAECGRPRGRPASESGRRRSPACVRSARFAEIPRRRLYSNIPKFSLLHYRKVFQFGRKHDSPAILEKMFNINAWGEAWRNGIYDYVHYHSMIHEVLGVTSLI